jgi:3-hydroxyacyl-CoA dehydrogenase
MKLIEIIKGKFTAEETIKTLYDLSIKIGKEPIVVNKDIRGFLTTRLIRTLRYQAIILYMRNFYSIPEIDSALIHKLGLPMGIFYLTDFTGGIQIEYDENKTYEKMKKFSPDFEPNIGFEKAYMESLKLIEKMIQEGKLGIKTGKGFYTYSSGKKLEIPKELGEKVDLLDLISPLINHAYFLIRIGVTDENSIDKSLKLGFNWKQGLFEFYRKNYSKEEIIRSLEKLSQKIPDLKEFYTPDELLVKGR